MSHSLAKKFDKIVSKLGNKYKEAKINENEATNSQTNQDDTNNDGNGESLLHRIKGHHQNTEGIPPHHVIVDDLKDSPFKGKIILYFVY